MFTNLVVINGKASTATIAKPFGSRSCASLSVHIAGFELFILSDTKLLKLRFWNHAKPQ